MNLYVCIELNYNQPYWSAQRTLNVYYILCMYIISPPQTQASALFRADVSSALSVFLVIERKKGAVWSHNNQMLLLCVFAPAGPSSH